MLSQIIAVTGVNIRSIRERLGSSVVAVIGIAGVVLVFVAVLSIAEGVKATMEASGDPNTVMVMRAGSDTEMTSGLAGDAVRIIQDAPGIARDSTGTPLTSPELFVVVGPSARSDRARRPTCRCAASRRRRSRCTPSVKIVEGRNFEPGKNEIIVGRAATASVRRPHRRHDAEVGREHVAARRHLRRRGGGRRSPRSGAT